MTKKILAGMGVLALLIAAGAAWAHGPGRRFMMKQMIDSRVTEAEDLIQATPEQRAVIEQSKTTIVQALQARFQERRNTHQQLVDLLTAPTLDSQKLYAFADQRAAEVQDLAKVIVPQIQKVHDALTPAQLDKLKQKANEMHQKHQQNKGGFGGPGE